MECVRIYKLRWRIEDFHRVVKNTCGIEELSYRTAAAMTRHVAIAMVIANRIMMLTQLGRLESNLPESSVFTKQQIVTLNILADTYNLHQPDTLSNAIRIISVHGGFTNRKSDTAGYEIFSLGLNNLQYTELGAKKATELAVKKIKDVFKSGVVLVKEISRRTIEAINSSKTLEECKEIAKNACKVFEAILYFLALEMIYGVKMLN